MKDMRHMFATKPVFLLTLMLTLFMPQGCAPAEKAETTLLLRKDHENLRYYYPFSRAISNTLVCQYYLKNPSISDVVFFDIESGRRIGSHTIPFRTRLFPVGKNRLAVCPNEHVENMKAPILGYLLDLSDLSKRDNTVAIRPGWPIGILDANLVVQSDVPGPGDRGDYRLYNLANGTERILEAQKHGLNEVGGVCAADKLVISGFRPTPRDEDERVAVTQLWSFDPLRKVQEYVQEGQYIPTNETPKEIGPDAFAFQVGIAMWSIASAKTGAVRFTIGTPVTKQDWSDPDPDKVPSIEILGGKEYIRDTGRILTVQEPSKSKNVLVVAYDAKTGKQLQKRAFPSSDWIDISVARIAEKKWGAMIHLGEKQVTVPVDDINATISTLRVPSLLGGNALVYMGRFLVVVRDNLTASVYRAVR